VMMGHDRPVNFMLRQESNTIMGKLPIRSATPFGFLLMSRSVLGKTNGGAVYEGIQIAPCRRIDTG